uniref:Uncharacterized protein n=1 Tax=Rhizophora mucronata TaxID=61149 RepID=A0A2P2MGH3_RHIMU
MLISTQKIQNELVRLAVSTPRGTHESIINELLTNTNYISSGRFYTYCLILYLEWHWSESMGTCFNHYKKFINHPRKRISAYTVHSIKDLPRKLMYNFIHTESI